MKLPAYINSDIVFNSFLHQLNGYWSICNLVVDLVQFVEEYWRFAREINSVDAKTGYEHDGSLFASPWPRAGRNLHHAICLN